MLTLVLIGFILTKIGAPNIIWAVFWITAFLHAIVNVYKIIKTAMENF